MNEYEIFEFIMMIVKYAFYLAITIGAVRVFFRW